MKKIMLLLLLFFLSVKNASGDENKCPTRSEKSVLVFGNGMFNSYTDALRSLYAVADKVGGPSIGIQYKIYNVAYNFNETPLLQLLEVFRQKSNSIDRFRWTYFSKFSGPQWFQEAMKEKARNVGRKEFIIDADLRNHMEYYNSILKQNFNITVVAHSQGNLYVNNSYLILKDKFPKLDDLFMIVGVASPDSEFYGQGGYITLESDWVIRSIPGSLPYNVSNGTNGLFEHAFVDNYLSGNNSGEEIANLIVASYDSLNRLFMPRGYLHDSLSNMNQWMAVYEKNNYSKDYQLNKTQCLAIELFLKMEDFFGIPCQERSLDGLKKDGQYCLKTSWGKGSRGSRDRCNLLGYFADISGSSQMSAMRVLSSQQECDWHDKVDITQSMLDEAYLIVSDPNKYMKKVSKDKND